MTAKGKTKPPPAARPVNAATDAGVDWEKLHAPKITRGHVVAGAAVYLIWLGFLGVLAAQRWLGALH